MQLLLRFCPSVAFHFAVAAVVSAEESLCASSAPEVASSSTFASLLQRNQARAPGRSEQEQLDAAQILKLVAESLPPNSSTVTAEGVEVISTDDANRSMTSTNSFGNSSGTDEAEAESSDSSEALGCCFSFGYGKDMKPCCLSTEKMVDRAKCAVNPEELIGGSTAFVEGECPATAKEAADLMGEDAPFGNESETSNDEPMLSNGTGGCCFSYGFGSEMEPCCLSTEMVAKRSECPEQPRLVGGGTAFTLGACPANASEAATLAGDAQDQLSAAAAKASVAEKAAEEAASKAAEAISAAKSRYYKAIAEGATSESLENSSKAWEDASAAHSDAYLKSVGAAQADEALARVLAKEAGKEKQALAAEAAKKEDVAKQKREAAEKKKEEAAEAEAAAKKLLEEARDILEGVNSVNTSAVIQSVPAKLEAAPIALAVSH